MKLPLGLAAAFLAGFGVMALEILAARWLAPAFGFTLTTWAFLIAATLLAGSVGAAGGGLVARPARSRAAGLAFAGAAVWIATDAFAAPTLVDRLLPLAQVTGILLACSLLLVVPVGLLAAVLPLVAERVRGSAGTGRLIGLLVAASTAGSLAGTLTTALLCVPSLGLRTTALGLAAACAGFGGLLLGTRRSRLAGAAGAVLIPGLALVPARAPTHDLVRETPYGRLTLDRILGRTELRVDGILQGATSPAAAGRGALLSRRQYFELLPFLHPVGTRALQLGLGGGIVPACLAEYGIQTESIEINRALVQVLRDELGFDGPVRIGDARAEVRRLSGTYDFAILDAFQGASLPAHLVTREALEELRVRLTDGGVLCIHLIGKPKHRVTGAIHATLGAVFHHVLALQSGVSGEMQDLFLFASDRTLAVPPAPELAAAGWLGNESFEPPSGPILSDDRNPLERWNEPLAREFRHLSLREP